MIVTALLQLQIIQLRHILRLDAEIVKRLLLRRVPIRFHQQWHGLASFVLPPASGFTHRMRAVVAFEPHGTTPALDHIGDGRDR